MEKRRFGRTGLDVSVLGFGCGAVGGLMVKGEPADQERAVWRALSSASTISTRRRCTATANPRRNLGRVFKALKPDVYVGTKVRLPPTEPGRIGEAIAASLEASLKRLQLEQVDLFQFHNAIVGTTRGANFRADMVLDEVVPAFERLRHRGSAASSASPPTARPTRCTGSSTARVFDTGQASFNLLNPSPAGAGAGGLSGAGLPEPARPRRSGRTWASS